MVEDFAHLPRSNTVTMTRVDFSKECWLSNENRIFDVIANAMTVVIDVNDMRVSVRLSRLILWH